VPVTRKKPPKKKAKVVRRTRKAATVDLSLPSEPCTREADLSKYVTMVFGRAGIGKTTWAASWPKCLMFSCERISQGIAMYDFNRKNGGVTSWRVFEKGLDLLEGDYRFNMVGIDTIDALYQYALEHVCKKRGILHPGDEGWGGAWNEVQTTLRNGLKRILRMGKGIVMTSHYKEMTVELHSGKTFVRIVPSATNQAYGIVRALCDLTFYAEYMTSTDGENLRVLVTTGDELVEAKNSLDLPRFLPMTKEDGFMVLQGAALGDKLGIPVSRLMASPQNKEVETLLQEERKRVRKQSRSTGRKKTVRKKKTTK